MSKKPIRRDKISFFNYVFKGIGTFRESSISPKEAVEKNKALAKSLHKKVTKPKEAQS